MCVAADGYVLERTQGYVMYLIQQRKWGELAKTLSGDRQLAVHFFDDHPLSPGCYDAKIRKFKVEKIDLLQHRYFESLSSADKFRLSKHAIELSAGKKSLADDVGGLALDAEHGESPLNIATKERTKSILSSIVSGIKALGPGHSRRFGTISASLSNKADEKTSLV